MPLSALERRRAIVNTASASSTIGVEELARHFEVTPSTIRRDLARLEHEGKLARTYGGVRAVISGAESSLAERLGEAHLAKQSIARRAAQEISPHETVLLDAGTTVAALAHEVRGLGPLHLVAAGMTVLEELSERTHEDLTLTVDVLGGRLRPLSQGFVGPLAEASVERMSFERAFFGADGVDAEFGINEADLQQTRLKELIAHRSRNVYVLAHHAKLGSRAMDAWAALRLPWTLITDAEADPGRLQLFRDAGVNVIVADP